MHGTGPFRTRRKIKTIQTNICEFAALESNARANNRKVNTKQRPTATLFDEVNSPSVAFRSIIQATVAFCLNAIDSLTHTHAHAAHPFRLKAFVCRCRGRPIAPQHALLFITQFYIFHAHSNFALVFHLHWLFARFARHTTVATHQIHFEGCRAFVEDGNDFSHAIPRQHYTSHSACEYDAAHFQEIDMPAPVADAAHQRQSATFATTPLLSPVSIISM